VPLNACDADVRFAAVGAGPRPACVSPGPECPHSTVRIFPNNVLPCPVVHQQNSRTTHGMNQPPLRSLHVPTATHPNSKRHVAHSNHTPPFPLFLIRSSAIRSARNSSLISVESYSDRSKNACLCARFSHVLHSTNHQPHRKSHACLIATQILEVHLTCSQQMREVFLIATFSDCLANHCSPITLHQSLR
jgi:hypothetical protein